MKHRIDRAALEEKSEELEIPFSHLLAGYVVESLMYLITESEFWKYLWLKTGSLLGVDKYKKESIPTLEFAYLADEDGETGKKTGPGQKLSLKTGYLILASVLKEEKVPEIRWRGRVSFCEGVAALDVEGGFEDIVIPVHIELTEIGRDSAIPLEKELPLTMDHNRTITVMEYPSDSILAEQLLEILKDIELTSLMQAYDTIYQILDRQPVQGRHIQSLLADLCNEEGFPMDPDRVDEILLCRDQAYLKKRWGKYLRHQKRKEPSWEMVMEKISAFLPVIWNSICQDILFFGDWMPELGRFLD